MEYVLITSSKISCDHPPLAGGGAVTLIQTQTLLSINGDSVITGKLEQMKIDSTKCSRQNTQSGEKPCSSVLTQSDGFSKVLKVNGSAVLLKSSTGETDGSPKIENTWSVKDANQTLLQAD